MGKVDKNNGASTVEALEDMLAASQEREEGLEELVKDMNNLLRMFVYDNEPMDDISGTYGEIEQRIEDLGIEE